MRYPKGHKEQTRGRIVAAAARRFREKGYRGAGVDDVMKAAGLTPGGFYAHFASKEDLLAETLAASSRQTREMLLTGLEEHTGADWLLQVMRRYLSRMHRDAVADGCAMPALTADVARSGDASRQRFESYLLELVGELVPKTPPAPGLEPEDRVLASVALAAGGLMLARAVQDEALSDRILRACRRLAVPELAQPMEKDKDSTQASGPRTRKPRSRSRRQS
jgi:TetR/AcrR family transcriptional repressor of nem operon